MIAAAIVLLCAETVARLRAEPREVEVGEPTAWILEVEHAAGAEVRLPEGDPIPDDSWVLLEPRSVVRDLTDSETTGRATTRASWRVMSLEPGERALPAIELSVEESGEARKVAVQAGALSVRPALAPGEDAPRPMRGFRDPPQRPAAGFLPLLCAGALALAAGFLLWRRTRRKPASPTQEPTALERLAQIESTASQDPSAVRRSVYELCRLLRESTDAFAGADRAALIDVEWAALTESDERVPLGARHAITRILRDAERVKYAFHEPTRFALQETFASARSALEALAAAPPPAAVGGAAKKMEAAA